MVKTQWTGDDGKTSMFGGEKTDKDSTLVEAYGTIDELNSSIGMCIDEAENEDTKEILKQVQNHLFTLGSDLATRHIESTAKRISDEEIKWIEEQVRKIDKQLPELKNFILPGGSEGSLFLHIARTVARRAERRVVSAKRENKVNENIVKYLNRLSSLLFSLARYENILLDKKETEWKG